MAAKAVKQLFLSNEQAEDETHGQSRIHHQPRSPLQDIFNEPRAKKTCLSCTASTSPQINACYDGPTTVWAPAECQPTPIAVGYASNGQFDSKLVSENIDYDDTTSFATARGILDAIPIRSSEAVDSFFATATGNSPFQSVAASPSAASDITVATNSAGDIAEAASSIIALNSDIKRWARWTVEEDQLLQTAIAVEGLGENWLLISSKYFHGSRNDVQIKNRWKKTLHPGLNNDSKWSTAEDAIILECVVNKGTTNWSDIALLLSGKNSDQIKHRYENALDVSLKKNAKWTDEEYRILREQHAKHGNCWKAIASHLYGRTERNVKSKWYNMKTSEKKEAAAEAGRWNT